MKYDIVTEVLLNVRSALHCAGKEVKVDRPEAKRFLYEILHRMPVTTPIKKAVDDTVNLLLWLHR